MPWRIRKAPGKQLYWVVGRDGSHMSKEPLPLSRAKAQMRALYASERQERGGRMEEGAYERDMERKAEQKRRRVQRAIDQILNELYENDAGEYFVYSSSIRNRTEGIPEDEKRDFVDSIVEILATKLNVPVTVLDDGIDIYGPTDAYFDKRQRAIQNIIEKAVERIRRGERYASVMRDLTYSVRNKDEDDDNEYENVFDEDMPYIGEEVHKRTRYPFSYEPPTIEPDFGLLDMLRDYQSADAAAYDASDVKRPETPPSDNYVGDEERNLKGEGLSDVVRGLTKRVKNVFKGIRRGYSPAALQTINQYGDSPIVAITVRRAPLQRRLESFLNLLSMGAWNRAKQAANYDDLYHLSLVVMLDVGGGAIVPVLIEKNQVINITPTVQVEPGTQFMNVEIPPIQLTLKQFLENGLNQMGEAFWLYDAFYNNCQDFLLGLLAGNQINDVDTNNFIKQPLGELLKKLPWYARLVSRGLTDTAALADVALQGEGLKKYSLSGEGMMSAHNPRIAAALSKMAAPLSRALDSTNTLCRPPTNWLYCAKPSDVPLGVYNWGMNSAIAAKVFMENEDDELEQDHNLELNQDTVERAEDMLDVMESKMIKGSVYLNNRPARNLAFSEKQVDGELGKPMPKDKYIPGAVKTLKGNDARKSDMPQLESMAKMEAKANLLQAAAVAQTSGQMAGLPPGTALAPGAEALNAIVVAAQKQLEAANQAGNQRLAAEANAPVPAAQQRRRPAAGAAAAAAAADAVINQLADDVIGVVEDDEDWDAPPLLNREQRVAQMYAQAQAEAARRAAQPVIGVRLDAEGRPILEVQPPAAAAAAAAPGAARPVVGEGKGKKRRGRPRKAAAAPAIVMPVSDFKEEHKNLVSLLTNAASKLTKEAKEQAHELKTKTTNKARRGIKSRLMDEALEGLRRGGDATGGMFARASTGRKPEAAAMSDAERAMLATIASLSGDTKNQFAAASTHALKAGILHGVNPRFSIRDYTNLLSRLTSMPAAARRGRGRPKGSANKKGKGFGDVLTGIASLGEKLMKPALSNLDKIPGLLPPGGQKAIDAALGVAKSVADTIPERSGDDIIISSLMGRKRRGKGKPSEAKKAVEKPGAFEAQAKRAKMTVQQFADHVLANPSKFQARTRQRAEEAKKKH